jgi:hypothetical protein
MPLDMRTHLTAIVAACALLPASSCTSDNSGVSPDAANAVCACDAGQECITGGRCAMSCSPDSGASCPSGGACQFTPGYCVGTACKAESFWVCR